MIDNALKPQDRGRQRLLWSLLASVALNTLWVTYPRLHFDRDVAPPELVVSTARIEHRRVTHQHALPHPHARPRPLPRRPAIVKTIVAHRPLALKRVLPKKKLVAALMPSEHPHVPRPHARLGPSRDLAGSPSMSFTKDQNATLKVPVNWDQQDFANGAAADKTLWVDFRKARGAVVPRVFLLHLKTAYMSGPTLPDAVHDILANLASEGAKMYVSKAKRVCRGTRPGWFLSYKKPNDDPPLEFVDTLYVSGDTVYRATYSRPEGQPMDAKTVTALSTLCSW